MVGLGRATAVCAVSSGGLWHGASRAPAGVACPGRDDQRSRSKTAASAMHTVRHGAYNGYWLHQGEDAGCVCEITRLCYACAGSNDACGDHAEMQLPGASAVVRHLCRYDVLQGDKDSRVLIG
jgi:hypothetical protein